MYTVVLLYDRQQSPEKTAAFRGQNDETGENMIIAGILVYKCNSPSDHP